MTSPHSRRQLLAAAIPFALAGCLLEPAQGPVDGDQQMSSPNQSPANNPPTTETTTTAQTNDSDTVKNTSNGGATVPADPAGIEIDSVEISRIIESRNQSQIVADITVRNTGTQAYGALEIRVDAYYNPPPDDRTYHPPRVSERTAVGRTYADRTFESFESGTRVFEDVVIQYDAEDANGSVDPALFDVTVAVRHAEPR